MKDIFKINSLQVYNMWRNTAYGLLMLIAVILLAVILPSYTAPIVSTAAAFAIYLLAYNETNRRRGCLRFAAVVMISLISYSFLLVLLNLASLWITSFDIPYPLNFFSDPYLPILLLAPVMLVTALTMLIRGQGSNVCTDCLLANGHYTLRGRWGIILHRESRTQLRNIASLSAMVSLLVYLYYFTAYNPVNITPRDYFVFYWLPILILIADTIYFGVRYYNLYLDLKERDQVVSPQELSEMHPRTWVRYYVICEDNVFLNMHAPDQLAECDRDTVVETPFVVSRESTGITEGEAAALIRSLTGVRDGKLRFFFGRKSPDNLKHSVMRYFYFLPGEPERYKNLNDVEGTWISSNKFKTLLYNSATRFSPLLKTDMTRLATIVITSKTFDERGERRTRLKQYHPSFNFEELYDSSLNFQDNEWLRISCFNSDTANFRIKRLWRSFTRRNNVQLDD